jgi:hypothetical protein
MTDIYDLTSASGLRTPGWRQNKWDATVAPTVNEDSGDGYEVGSVWVDVTADKAYTCVDSTVGAAVWVEGGSSLTAASTVTDETTFGISAAVGVDADYAREDHTHGSPANPVTAAAVKALGRWEPVQFDDGSSPWPFVYFDDEIVVAWVATP